jgi:hypothetical protein
VNGVGKFCRERETSVAERRQILDTAMAAVGNTADPQTDAAVKLVAWVTVGELRLLGEDFAHASPGVTSVAAADRRDTVDGQPIGNVARRELI